MSKDLLNRGLLSATVHPSIVALLFLVVTFVTVVGMDQYKTNITSHYDDINQIAENLPSFPTPAGTTAGISSETSTLPQDNTQPSETTTYTQPARRTTSRPESPSQPGDQAPPTENPKPVEPSPEPKPEPEPEPEPPAPLLCLIGICI